MNATMLVSNIAIASRKIVIFLGNATVLVSNTAIAGSKATMVVSSALI